MILPSYSFPSLTLPEERVWDNGEGGRGREGDFHSVTPRCELERQIKQSSVVFARSFALSSVLSRTNYDDVASFSPFSPLPPFTVWQIFYRQSCLNNQVRRERLVVIVSPQQPLLCYVVYSSMQILTRSSPRIRPSKASCSA